MWKAVIFLETILEPEQRISKDAIKVWRIHTIITHVILFLILTTLLFLDYYFNWISWLHPILFVVIAIAVIHAIYRIFIYPVYQQYTWRYEIDPAYIQIKSGVIVKTHIIIPMTKVQYVNTNQGPLLRKYKLAVLTIGTMASSHDIPALPIETAIRLRKEVAYLAKVTEDETYE